MIKSNEHIDIIGRKTRSALLIGGQTNTLRWTYLSQDMNDQIEFMMGQYSGKVYLAEARAIGREPEGATLAYLKDRRECQSGCSGWAK